MQEKGDRVTGLGQNIRMGTLSGIVGLGQEGSTGMECEELWHRDRMAGPGHDVGEGSACTG